MKRLNNKIALITGAARGIGRATAELFETEGATVIVADILEEVGQALADSIQGYFIKLDVANPEDWETAYQIIRRKFDRIDVLFNNAGITGLTKTLGSQDPENTTLNTWHHVHAINLDGVFLGCQYGIKLMKKHGGSIINMSSRSGMVGVPNACAYASSKAAIRNHTKSVALYCAEKHYNIRCNSVHPAAILTPIWESLQNSNSKLRHQGIERIASNIPLGHMGNPIDVAYAVIYLASNESEYTTGSELIIDGGILAGSLANLSNDNSVDEKR